MNLDCTVRADAISSRSGFVGVPTNFLGRSSVVGASHVRLESEGQEAIVLQLFSTGNPTGDQLIVEPGVLSLRDGETLPARFEALSGSGYRRYWLLNTRSGRLALFGLLLVAIGQSIQVSLDLGEAWAWFSVGPEGIAFAKAAKGGLTMVGGALALYQTALKA